MKRAAKRVISSVLRNRAVWLTVQMSLGKAAAGYGRLEKLRKWQAAEQEQRENDRKRRAEKYREVFSSSTVLNGPFKGMKYPSLRSFGSTLYPKLLGSYEWELRGVLEAIMSRNYSAVVDIGCAEGYYAIGLGRHFRNAKIYAYDTDNDALKQCKEMAELNGVKLTTGGLCDRSALTSLDFGRHALIFSDCEGYENVLFDATVADQLRPHDLLIETHDFIQIESTRNILSAFRQTHDCQVIESLDDIVKAYTYEFLELTDLSLEERRRLLGEYRPAIMKWVFATSRHPRPREDFAI